MISGEETDRRTNIINESGWKGALERVINKDVVPAMLTPGEFVMTRETTDRIGASVFESLNKGADIDKSYNSS